MRRKLFVILVFVFVFFGFWLMSSCVSNWKDNSNDSATTQNRNASPANSSINTAGYYEFNFPSFDKKYGPPSWWKDEVFQLKQDYPKNYEELTSPCPVKECPWKKPENNFKEHPNEYLQEIIKYAYEGNLEVNWVIQKNTKGRKWFHAPFMHFDIVKPCLKPDKECKPEIVEKVGREFIHGMTMERLGCLSALNYQVGNKDCPFMPTNPREHFQSWAISFYNERGASYIGKVWEEVLKSTPNPQSFPAKGFPDGTMAIKLLFTQASANDGVNYLENSVEWKADTGDFDKEGFKNTKRISEKGTSEEECKKDEKKCFSTMRLLQIDVAVRDDSGNSPTGWVFATFTYDKDAKPFIKYESEAKDKDKWMRITPLGLMFGNDPAKQKGDELKETWLNTELKIPQHYGCGDDANPLKRRLNGPVDNPASSCISCHAQSETPQNLNIGSIPYITMKCEDKDNIAKWFRNINPRSSNVKERTFTASTQDMQIFSLDYSLQLREGIRRYCMESYNHENNNCGFPPFQKGETFTVITKEGARTLSIQ
jgi:hypothetical protein